MYINGILAPDMTLQRGKEYTFVVETGLGSDPDQTFHPLYITSDPIGNIQNCKGPFKDILSQHRGGWVGSENGNFC